MVSPFLITNYFNFYIFWLLPVVQFLLIFFFFFNFMGAFFFKEDILTFFIACEFSLLILCGIVGLSAISFNDGKALILLVILLVIMACDSVISLTLSLLFYKYYKTVLFVKFPTNV